MAALEPGTMMVLSVLDVMATLKHKAQRDY